MTVDQLPDQPPPGAQGPGTLAKTATGTAWIVAWRMASRTLGLLSTIVLVRLLQPMDFGLIALASSFNQSIEALSWFGLEEALIREKAPTRDTYDTAFTLSLLRGASLALVIGVLAYPAAKFFSEPRLAMVILTLALSTLLDGCNNIGTVDFRRHFSFDKEFKLMILPRVLGTVAAITAAALLRSYWALVIGVLTNRILRIGAGYVMHPHRPRLVLKDWRKLTSYSFWTWVFGIVSMIAGQADTFMIGRMLNTTSVGFYAVGGEMAFLPHTELVEPLSRSTFSAFSESRRLARPAAEIWLRVSGAAALLVLPASVGISLVAENLLRVFFGVAWLAAVPVVHVLGVAATAALFGAISTCLFQAYGQLRLMVGIRAGLVVLRLALLALLLPFYGLVGAALAVAISMVAEQTALSVMAFRQMGASVLRELVPMLWRCVVAVAVMAGTLTVTGLGWGGDFTAVNPYLGLFGTSALGAAIYTASLIGLWFASGKPNGPEADVLDMTRRLLARVVAVTRQALLRLRREQAVSVEYSKIEHNDAG
jgi:lipopolysaccharide exporter